MIPHVPVFANGAISGTYGDSTHTSQIVIDSFGRVSSATNVTITGTTPGGSAGGSLTGSYPNPTIATSAVTSANLSADALLAGQGFGKRDLLQPNGVTTGQYGSATQSAQVTIDSFGRVSSVTNVTITGVVPGGSAGGSLTGSYPNPTIATSAVTSANLSADALLAGQGFSKRDLLQPNGVGSGQYGSASQTSQVTIDPWGRVTSAANVTIAAFPDPYGFQLTYLTSTTFSVAAGKTNDSLQSTYLTGSTTTITVNQTASGNGGSDNISISGTVSQTANTVSGASTSFLTMYPVNAISGVTFTGTTTTLTASSTVAGQLCVGDLVGNASCGYSQITAINATGLTITVSKSFAGLGNTLGPAGATCNRIEQPTFTAGTSGTTAMITSISNNTTLTTDLSQTIAGGTTGSSIGKPNNNSTTLNTYMHVWIALSGGSPIVFVSTQRTSPLAFSQHRRIGFIAWFNGAIRPFKQIGGANERTYIFELAANIGGNQFTPSGSTTWARQSFASFLPQTATLAYVTVSFTANTGGDSLFWACPNIEPSGNMSAGNRVFGATTATTIVTNQIFEIDSFQAISQASTSASDSTVFYVSGCGESLNT